MTQTAFKWKRRAQGMKQMLGQKLRDYRVEHGITQKAVAKKIGCHDSALSFLESGKFGSFALIEAYAHTMGLELQDLLRDRDRGRA